MQEKEIAKFIKDNIALINNYAGNIKLFHPDNSYNFSDYKEQIILELIDRLNKDPSDLSNVIYESYLKAKSIISREISGWRNTIVQQDLVECNAVIEDNYIDIYGEVSELLGIKSESLVKKVVEDRMTSNQISNNLECNITDAVNLRYSILPMVYLKLKEGRL